MCEKGENAFQSGHHTAVCGTLRCIYTIRFGPRAWIAMLDRSPKRKCKGVIFFKLFLKFLRPLPQDEPLVRGLSQIILNHNGLDRNKHLVYRVNELDRLSSIPFNEAKSYENTNFFNFLSQLTLTRNILFQIFFYLFSFCETSLSLAVMQHLYKQ